ncbi:polymorphic outer membrane protein repeat-containing protein [Anaerosphaera aminiphila DSM 21120]|uniref:Polymorphic outer membrane protein repeat-containing protein n=1 Tax=Anaerosphaera aminiphila DSM 21120 TaxID=1120995 RepID=A0A1M5QED6_9FIRM|nr:S-layer homology domain-containing protein [Anaerosphaera aminiphila]SHH12564.1 polymorphic outer membrane protein repeat-containing protein [Anaerosphaera aminiphila DSM 21120]
MGKSKIYKLFLVMLALVIVVLTPVEEFAMGGNNYVESSMTENANLKGTDEEAEVNDDLNEENLENLEEDIEEVSDELFDLKLKITEEIKKIVNESILKVKSGEIKVDDKEKVVGLIETEVDKALKNIEDSKSIDDVENVKIQTVENIEHILSAKVTVLSDEENLETGIEVTNFEELKTAIEEGTEDTIIIANDIEMNGEIYIRRPLTIIGKGKSFKILKPSDDYYGFMFTISEEASAVTFENLIFDGSGKSWAISSFAKYLKISDSQFINNKMSSLIIDAAEEDAEIIVENSLFENNKSDNYYAGGINIQRNSGTIDISNNKFKGNSVNYYGGAICINDNSGTININDGYFEKNSTALGGAIGVIRNAGTININDGCFKENIARELGGAIYFEAGQEYENGGGSMNIRDTKFIENTTGNNGGAIYFTEKNSLKIDDSTFKNNKSNNGGAIYTPGKSSKSIEINNTDFIGNIATYGDPELGAIAGKGGALHFDNATVKINGGNFEDNTAIAGGGAIYINDNAENSYGEKPTGINLTVSNANFKNNSTSDENGFGGAIYSGKSPVEEKDTLTIGNTKFEENKTTGSGGDGGAVFTNSDIVVLDTVNFAKNSTEKSASGGALYIMDSDAKIDNSTFTDNSVNRWGGAVVVYDSVTNVNNSKFTNNKTSSEEEPEESLGGAIYVYGDKGKLNIASSDFDENKATYGGGIHLELANSVEISNSNFTKNTASINGGAINVFPREDRITTDEDFIYYSPLKVSDSKFTENTAGNGFYRLAKDSFPKIYGVYKTNVKGLKSLSTPADLEYDTAYNNYDISYVDELIILKTDNLSNDKVKIGDVFKYSITVEDTDNIDKKEVKISDEIPNKLDVISVTPKDAKITGQKIEYTVPEIKTGETFTMTIEVKVNTSVKDGDKIKNVALVDGQYIASRELIVDEPSTSTGWTWSGGGSTTTTLNKDDHYAYMIGYPNGTVKSEGKITRAEVSTIFFRMMTDDSRNSNWSSVNNYDDVGTETWYNNAISTLSNAKAVTGYPDGNFKPNAKITRGEFATMASRFLSDTSLLTNNKFTDVKGNWAEESINKLASLGLISGYTDGSFKPDQEITRAEAATLMNAVLERTPDKDHLLSNMKKWTDNSNKNAWYYAQIQEATNSHTYTRSSKTSIETWRELLPVRDWAALEKAWSSANSASGGGSVIK